MIFQERGNFIFKVGFFTVRSGLHEPVTSPTHTINHASAWPSSTMTFETVGQFKSNSLLVEFHKNKTTREATNLP